MYDRGLGVKQSDHEAVRWYIRAAEQGHAQAQNNLGVMYGTGRGVAQNNAEALKWFELSAEQGNPQARYNLTFLREKERAVMAKRPQPALPSFKPQSETAKREESVRPNEGLTPPAPRETQVATTSPVPEGAMPEDKPGEVKLDTIVSKKVSRGLKVEEKKTALEPRPAPTTDDAGPVAALVKIQELKGRPSKPAEASEAVKAVVKSETLPAGPEAGTMAAARAADAKGTATRDAPNGEARITLTAKTQIAALTEPKRPEKPKTGAGKPAKAATVQAAPQAPVQTSDQASVQAPVQAKAAPPKKAPVVAEKKKAKTYQVQMASIKADSDAAADKLVRRLERSYPSAFEDTKVYAARADLGKRGTYYRLRAGPFPDFFAAQDVCDKLKARNQPCFVLHR